MESNCQKTETVAEVLYNEYADSVGWKSVSGSQLPSWAELVSNSERQIVVAGWRAVAHKARVMLTPSDASDCTNGPCCGTIAQDQGSGTDTTSEGDASDEGTGTEESTGTDSESGAEGTDSPAAA